MSDTKKQNTSPFGVFSFPHLFVPKAPSPGAEERYSTILLFDHVAQNTPEYKQMRKAVADAAAEKWGGKGLDMLKNGQLRTPFRDASEKAGYAGFTDGKIFVNFWTKSKPGVIDGQLNDLAPEDCYPGMVGRVTYSAFAYDNSGNRGVSLFLGNVQITDLTTPRLDGRIAANKDFDATDMAVADMTNGGTALDDELPF
jgi:hypothetical protein